MALRVAREDEGFMVF